MSTTPAILDGTADLLAQSSKTIGVGMSDKDSARTAKILATREAQAHEEMIEGQRVEVRLSGAGEEDDWWSGTVLDRPRKMWVELDDYYGEKFIADEGNITEWRVLEGPK